MADVFVILIPAYPTVPVAHAARNVALTANVNNRSATATRVPLYHQRPKRKVFATKKT